MDVRNMLAPVDRVDPVFVMKGHLPVRIVVCAVLTTMGMYYLDVGRKEQALQKLFTGCVLIMAGLLAFW